MYRLEQHHGDVLREPANGYDIRYFDEIRKTEWVKCIEWLLQEPYVLLELDGDPVPFNQLHANVLLLSIYRLSHTCTIHFCPGKTKLHILIFSIIAVIRFVVRQPVFHVLMLFGHRSFRYLVTLVAHCRCSLTFHAAAPLFNWAANRLLCWRLCFR